ncbi:longitudinals lacking protein, isoforms A/B/D/L-like isoform X3 [Rhodnius prolixus]|uniref:longitudinals lacking protein, isoforms A/B/D/L-like isoform X3 n=1 Tax=Rhodnius prolixus TaxID=13249 RepID=UPI003D18A018
MEGPFQCELCSKLYCNKFSLRAHEKYDNFCGSEPNVCCPLCAYTSKKPGHVKRHLKLRHKYSESCALFKMN